MIPYHLFCATALVLAAAAPAPLLAQQQGDKVQANKEKALAIAKGEGGGYENLITQHAPKGNAPDPKLFVQWILDEINNDSVMRDQIGDELADIQNNGRNSGSLTFYYTRDKQYPGRLWFKAADIAITSTGGGKEGVYDYQVVLRARDAFRGGFAIKSFRYTFKAKSEYFPATKANMVNAVSYPLFVDKKETETK